MPEQTPTRPLNPQERVDRITRAMHEPIACPHCGSTWFAELTFNQYAKGLYSVGAGGDLSVISTMPHTVRFCLCGRVDAPNLSGVRGGRHASGEQQSFLESLRKAHGASFDQARLDEQFNTLVKSLALQETLDSVKSELEGKLRSLEAKINQLEKAAGKASTGPGRPPKTASKKG